MHVSDHHARDDHAANLPADQHFDLSNPPALDTTRRPETLNKKTVRASCRRLGDVATGLLLLWHDHWDAAHEVAQSNEGERDHDLLHYLVHRREGDFGNAAYWLREAGAHPCFARIPALLEPLIPQDPPLFRKLLPDGRWDPRAFLDAVKKGGNPDLLRTVQAVEMRALWEMVNAK